MEQTQGLGSSPRTAPAAWPASAGAEVYGMVVDDRLGSPVIRLGLDRLALHPAERLVFLCLPPHDIRERTDWAELQSHLRRPDGQPLDYEVRIMSSPAQLLDASLEMRILRLPTDDVII